jgi:hypothetical protein
MQGGKNIEGYSDPTATAAFGMIEREKREEDERNIEEIRKMIHTFRYIADIGGYEICSRITLKKKKSGRYYK